MNQLVFLIAAAFMVMAGIYLGQQGMALARVNKIMRGVVKSMEATKPFALTKPQAELAEAVRIIWAMADEGWCMHGEEGMSDAQQAVCDFTLKYPRPTFEEVT